MGTQWRLAGMSALPAGLDYAALPAVLSMLNLAPSGELLADLQAIEAGALSALHAQAKRR